MVNPNELERRAMPSAASKRRYKNTLRVMQEDPEHAALVKTLRVIVRLNDRAKWRIFTKRQLVKLEQLRRLNVKQLKGHTVHLRRLVGRYHEKASQ